MCVKSGLIEGGMPKKRGDQGLGHMGSLGMNLTDLYRGLGKLLLIPATSYLKKKKSKQKTD